MELYNLKFSDNIRFSVEDIVDYKIDGTFDPEAVCDTEFYGYRETSFTVVSVESRLSIWLPESEETVNEFKNYYDDRITLIVQNAIDDKKGEL